MIQFLQAFYFDTFLSVVAFGMRWIWFVLRNKRKNYLGQTTQPSGYTCPANNETALFGPVHSMSSHSALNLSANCSILTNCNDSCSSNSFVCVTNTCCQSKGKCLPLFLTMFCQLTGKLSW